MISKTTITTQTARVQLQHLIGVCLLAIGLAHLIRLYIGWSTNQGIVLGVAIAALLLASGIGRSLGPRTGFYFPWSTLPILLFGTWLYFVYTFGWFEFEAILFHLETGVASPAVIWDYLRVSGKIVVGTLLVIGGVTLLARQDQRLRRADLFAALLLLLLNPGILDAAAFGYRGYQVDDRLSTLYTVAQPTPATPSPTPNLIHIFLESAERTYFDPAFGDAMMPLAPWEARGASATNVKQVALTHWSAAGITAATCGVPFLRGGFYNIRHIRASFDFLPGVVCTGDVLSQAGYEQTYIMGAEMSFAGLGHLFTSHGGHTLIGGDVLADRYRADDTSWGPDDGVVFAAGLDEVRRLSELGKPWAVTIDTVGGHAPHGVMSQRCHLDGEFVPVEPAILNGLKCTNWLAADFLAKLERENLLENTIVVVQSDHLAMKSPLTGRLDTMERRNLFFAFGEDIEPGAIDKEASPVDIMPTILTLLGYQLEQGRAGLGVSLLSEEPGLVERLGEDLFNEMIYGDTVLGRRLWRGGHTPETVPAAEDDNG